MTDLAQSAATRWMRLLVGGAKRFSVPSTIFGPSRTIRYASTITVTRPVTLVAMLPSTPAAGVVSPLAKLLIRSWLSCTHCSALVRSSRSPTGPRPLRASSMRPGS